ncbi:unnamed protein product [Dicrocoelium dendriticum]|nr:unnamed protein product [Dicrocoelium dendriticum]
MTDAEVSLPGMSLIRNDRLTKGGGVILYYRNDLQCEAVEDSDSQFPDSLWCRLQLKGRDACLIILVYRAPNSTPETDYHLMAALRCSLQPKYTHILIMGDFNVHCLEAPATTGEQFKTDLQDLVTTAPLYNHITLPTRFRTGNRPSVLDLVLTNEEHMIDALVLDCPLGRSDHAVISFNFVCYAEYRNDKDETVRTITRYDRLSQLVSATTWSFLEEEPPEVAWLEFVNTFSQLIAQASEIKAYNKCKSVSFVRSRTRKWMTVRNAAWRVYREAPAPETWDNYVAQRNHCTQLLREDKAAYQQNIAKTFSANHKLLYKHVNSLRKVRQGFPPLKTADGPTSTSMEAANALQMQYAPTFQTVLPPSDLPSFVFCSPGLTHINFTAEAVLQKLTSLRKHSSPGVDAIRPEALGVAANQLAGHLAQFFQHCLDQNQVPAMWKLGIISPIHKGGSRSDPSNYRPVTLLPILSKVMESIVADALVCYLENCNLITPEQHGFRRQRSCTTNLLIARSSWTEAADAGEGVDVIYLDFSKAFDRLDHRILLSKLQHYGIGDPLLSWIANFLFQRQLVVRVRSSLSDPIQVECGVPQGSVLGPRLFLVFINDLAQGIASNFLMFADDIKIWRRIQANADQHVLQSDLDTVYQWSIQNLLHFNVSKCKVLSIRHQGSYSYRLGTDVLQQSTLERDLGVLVQDDLGCSRQSEKASKTGNQHVGLLRRAFGQINSSIFRQMLSAYVRPHVEYAIQAWHPWLKHDLNALEQPQRRASKNVTGMRNLSYQERLRRLGLFSGSYRRLRGDLIMTYLILRDPHHVCRPLLQLSSNTNLRGHSLKLAEQYSRLECRRNFFSIRVCHPWNALPESVVSAPTLTIFKRRLDDALIHLHFVT